MICFSCKYSKCITNSKEEDIYICVCVESDKHLKEVSQFSGCDE